MMQDTPISKYVRDKRNLPDNWRVYLTEAVSDFKKVRVTGALVRPVDPTYEPHQARDYDWIKPITGKVQMTMTQAEYAAIYADKLEGKS